MERADVDRWLDRYVAAWKSYDPAEIGELFEEEVAYRYHPYDEPLRGREAVIESWRGEGDHEGAPTRDPEGTYDAEYRTVAIDGDVAVATGHSTYAETPGGPTARRFHNCFVIRFGPGGRCAEFTEWYIEEPRR